jgi:hypothetical protein
MTGLLGAASYGYVPMMQVATFAMSNASNEGNLI